MIRSQGFTNLRSMGKISVNLALNRPATGSPPCNADEGPEKAFNGSVTGGKKRPLVLVGLAPISAGGFWESRLYQAVVVKHAAPAVKKRSSTPPCSIFRRAGTIKCLSRS